MNPKKIFRGLKQVLSDIPDKIDNIKIYLYEWYEVVKMNHSKPVNNLQLSQNQKNEARSYWKKEYGKTVPLLWHKKYYGYSGNFDPMYFPEILYTTKLYNKQNPSKYCNVLADKNLIEFLFCKVLDENIDLTIPDTICGCSNGFYFDSSRHYITKDALISILTHLNRNVIIKPTVGESSGRGVKICDFSTIEVEEEIGKYGKNFIVQEIIKQNTFYKNLHPASINTIRIMTYRVEGEIHHCPIVMRIGCGKNYLDNAHAGGIYIGVTDDGILRKYALRNYCDKYDLHPDSNIKFEGYTVPFVPRIIELAKELHNCLPMIGTINWDFGVDDHDRIVLIESNLGRGGLWLFQNAWGKNPFGSDIEYMINMIRRRQ